MAGSAVFLVIAPGFVAGLVPFWISHWRVESSFLGMPLFRFGGGLFITLGSIGLLDSFVRFAFQGAGTPGAKVDSTLHSVARHASVSYRCYNPASHATPPAGRRPECRRDPHGD
jgi:hypothetical protein